MNDAVNDALEDELRASMKAEIRTRRRAVRRAMPHEARLARSAAICRRLVALPEWSRAQTVLAFVSMRSEVQTHEAVEAARAAGKRIGAPRMLPDFSDLEVREWRAEDQLEESGQMFLQPPSEAPTIPVDEIDLVIVPALAADERGHRIGYGKGFYDRLLPKLPRAFRAAVVFDFELLAEVPEHPFDAPVDVVITDRRELRRTLSGA